MSDLNNKKFLSNADDYIKSVLIYEDVSENGKTDTKLSLDKRDGSDLLPLIDTRIWNRKINLYDYTDTYYTIYDSENDSFGDINFHFPETIRNDVSPVVLNANGNKLLYSSSTYTEEIVDGETIQIYPILESDIILDSDRNNIINGTNNNIYDKSNDYKSNNNFIIGDLNAIGKTDDFYGRYNFIRGSHNIIENSYNTIIGTSNYISSGNYVFSVHNIINGFNNTIENGSSYNFINGGRNNISNSKNYTFLSGLGLIADNSFELLTGQYNAPVTNGRFVIGNGTDNENRSNLLSITDTGINLWNNFSIAHNIISEDNNTINKLSLSQIDSESFYLNFLQPINIDFSSYIQLKNIRIGSASISAPSFDCRLYGLRVTGDLESRGQNDFITFSNSVTPAELQTTYYQHFFYGTINGVSGNTTYTNAYPNIQTQPYLWYSTYDLDGNLLLFNFGTGLNTGLHIGD